MTDWVVVSTLSRLLQMHKLTDVFHVYNISILLSNKLAVIINGWILKFRIFFRKLRMASASPASVTSPQEAGPTNIIKMFTTFTNILAEATVREY